MPLQYLNKGIYIPTLPDNLSPFISIWLCENDNTITILSGDSPSFFEFDYSGHGNKIVNFRVCEYFNTTNNAWKVWDQNGHLWVEDFKFIYSNHDIVNIADHQDIKIPKTSDATEIKVAGGDTRNMQKGMIWNLSESISVLPSKSLQSCTFESSNPDVCTIDEKGKIVAISEGDCIITIKSKVF